RRITAAELGARAANIGGDNVTQVTVKCQASRVNILVSDPLSRKSVTRSFDIGLSDPRARSRLVAIAATELVLASWTELETNPTLHVEPIGPVPSRDVRKAAREIAKEKMEHYEPKVETWYELETPKERSLRIVAIASGRRFFTHGGGLYGAGLRMGEERFKFLAWAADAVLETGTILTGGETNYRVTTSTASGMLLGYLRSGAFTARAGAGLRVGLAASTSTSGQFSGATSLTPWGWPLGVMCFSLAGGGLVLDLSGEAGYVVLPVRGGGATIEGGWFAGQIGLGLVL
ncbi:MAG TPA: hypothetical protein VHE30_27905, partial [Polyangiaceae bacterium]|nr:hypothetical protein [Polyangiaceae bacterium]